MGVGADREREGKREGGRETERLIIRNPLGLCGCRPTKSRSSVGGWMPSRASGTVPDRESRRACAAHPVLGAGLPLETSVPARRWPGRNTSLTQLFVRLRVPAVWVRPTLTVGLPK